MLLGQLADAGIPPGERITLAPGQMIFLATDGLQETHSTDGSMFGVEPALDLEQTNRHKPSRDILEVLNAAASQFRNGAPQKDDIAMVVIEARAF